MGYVRSTLGALPEHQWARLESPRRSYQLTSEDVLWTARSTQFEGGTNPAATLWTHGQKFAAYSTRPTFTDFIRAYSQPINPRWDEPTDEMCIESPSRCSAAAIERRRRARMITWEEINPRIRDLTLRWATARLPNPVPRAVEFANPEVSMSFLRRNAGSEVVLKSGNWYIATRSSKEWPIDYVKMRLGDRTAGAGSSSVPLLLIAALIGGGAYWIARRGMR